MPPIAPVLPGRWTLRAVAAAIATSAVVVLAGGSTGPLAQTPAEKFTLTGDEVAIYNLAGRLQVVAGTGDAVTVEVTRGGADAARLKVATGPYQGRQALRVVYPEHRIVYPAIGRGSSTRTEVDDQGYFDDVEGHSVSITGSGSGFEAHADLKVRMPPGQKLRLYWVVGEVTVTNIEGELFVDHAAGGVAVDGIRGDLTLDTGSGDVRVNRARGDVMLDTGSGDLAITDMQGGRLALDTGSGSVTVSNVRVDDLSADTGSGAVTLRATAAGEIRLDSGSGPVEVDLAADAKSLVVDTGSGRVTLRLPRGASARFEIETSSGPIDIDVPYEASHVGRHEVRGQFGKGAGTIRIESGSGGVRVTSREARGAALDTWRGALLATLSIQ